MSLLSVVVILIVIGILIWLFNTKVDFIDAWYKKLVNVVVFVAVIIWLLKVFGLLDGLSAVEVPRV